MNEEYLNTMSITDLMELYVQSVQELLNIDPTNHSDAVGLRSNISLIREVIAAKRANEHPLR